MAGIQVYAKYTKMQVSPESRRELPPNLKSSTKIKSEIKEWHNITCEYFLAIFTVSSEASAQLLYDHN